MEPTGHGPILSRIYANKFFQLFEPKYLDIIDLNRIDEMFDGRVDFEIQMSSYVTKNLVLVYRYIDVEQGFNHFTHAVNLRHSYKHECWILKDSNKNDMVLLKSK